MRIDNGQLTIGEDGLSGMVTSSRPTSSAGCYRRFRFASPSVTDGATSSRPIQLRIMNWVLGLCAADGRTSWGLKNGNAMKYNVAMRRDPGTARVKYYGIPALSGTLTLDDVARNIERSSTMSTADVKAALDALEREVLDALRHGMSVRLGDLGSFRPTFRTKGAETPEEFDASMIEQVHVGFTSSKRMKEELSIGNLSFEKYVPLTTHEPKLEEEF